jgi:hypothetical protein
MESLGEGTRLPDIVFCAGTASSTTRPVGGLMSSSGRYQPSVPKVCFVWFLVMAVVTM